MMRRMSTLLGLGLLLGACGAMAQSTATFESLDTNKDGVISASEARKDNKVAARFAATDKNQDGYLDREEFRALQSGQ